MLGYFNKKSEMCFHRVPKNMFVYSWERKREREQKRVLKAKRNKNSSGDAKYVSTANILKYNIKVLQLDI